MAFVSSSLGWMPARCLLGATVVSVVAACGNSQATAPVSDFSAALAASNVAAQASFQQMNTFERTYYLDNAILTKQPVFLKDASGRPTGLLNTFSDQSLKARYDALALLNAYANKLAALAASNAPAQASTNAVNLGSDLVNLDKTFDRLARTPDPSAAKYAGPVSTIIGWIAAQVVEAKRQEAINAAVQEAGPAVDKVLTQLRDDLHLVQLLQSTGWENLRVAQVTYLNSHLANMPLSESKALVTDIEVSSDGIAATADFKPLALVEQTQKANQALITYVTSPHTPQDLAQLNSALQAFTNNVTPLMQAIVALKK